LEASKEASNFDKTGLQTVSFLPTPNFISTGLLQIFLLDVLLPFQIATQAALCFFSRLGFIVALFDFLEPAQPQIHRDELSFSNPIYQKIFDLYDEALQNGSNPDEMLFNFSTDHENFRNTVNGLTISRYELSENWLKNRVQVITEKEILMKALETTILSFKSKAVDRMMGELQQELKNATDEEDIMIFLSRQKGLKEISRKINSKLGRIITK